MVKATLIYSIRDQVSKIKSYTNRVYAQFFCIIISFHIFFQSKAMGQSGSDLVNKVDEIAQDLEGTFIDLINQLVIYGAAAVITGGIFAMFFVQDKKRYLISWVIYPLLCLAAIGIVPHAIEYVAELAGIA